MDANDFKPNSHKYNEDQVFATRAKREKVTTGAVSERKRNLGQRFGDIFFKTSLSDAKNYVIREVILPAIAENILDTINSYLGMLLQGEVSRRSYRPGQGFNANKTNYGTFYRGGEQQRERMPNYQTAKPAHNFSDILFENRADAENVLDGMVEILNSEYQQVTVLDFYDLAGMSSQPSDNKYGWRDLRNAQVVGSRSRGYYIDLPKCTLLD